MEKVKDILDSKGHEILSIDVEAPLYRALEKMVERNVGALLVTDSAGAVLGIFSERDFIRKIVFKGRDCENTTVKEAMTSKVLYVETETLLSDCMSIMTEKRVRHLPVMQDGKPVGIVSIGDVVKALLTVKDGLISEQAFEIGQLERYISGGP